jgi:hypothetical protein
MGTFSTLWGRRSFANKGQRRIQRLQRGQLPLVEAGEALGFGLVHRIAFCSPVFNT